MITSGVIQNRHISGVDIRATAEFILSVQNPDGEIPWSRDGRTDPWDHVESAMGLTVAGYEKAVRKAYAWSASTQLADGSWWSYYRNGSPAQGAYKDSNMIAYIAVGVYHYYLVTRDRSFLRRMWPVVKKAMDYVVDMQGPGGEILWAKRADGSTSSRALLTGSSSIYMSLKCALKIATLLGRREHRYNTARSLLGDAIRYRPERFDMSKARFSMDWYYPVLCGAITGDAAWKRIQKQWSCFAVPGWGVRCVSDRQWTTMAETAELAVTLAAIGRYAAAATTLNWILDKRYANGAFWTGVTFPDGIIYTGEQTTWTGAAVLLAADVLYDLTAGSHLFKHSHWAPNAMLRDAV
ncbi:FIG01121145: hypothetical protein [Olavius algarvensis associated proteobacterium Delta 3]|nr:FIG01121145: hypothetical protein [Olavius algarvensis associated proteobacterium Delta 3]